MNRSIIPPLIELEHSLLELADTYGLYASIYWLTKQQQHFRWSNGAFRGRSTLSLGQLMITLQNDRGYVGQALTENLTLSGAETAFHRARRALRDHPSLSSCIAQLSRQERRFPPLIEETSSQRDEYLFPYIVPSEKQHQKWAAVVAPHSLDTFLQISQENCRCIRSDGASHQAAIWRVIGVHRASNPSGKDLLCKAGFTASQLSAAAVQTLHAEMERQLDQLEKSLHFSAGDRLFAPTAAPVWLRPQTGCIIDSRLTAHLLAAAVQSQVPMPSSAIEATVETVEGSGNYQPIHPFGYLLTPTQLSLPSELHTLLYGLSQPEPLPIHLSVRFKSGDQAHSSDRQTIARQIQQSAPSHDGELLFFEGMELFDFDRETAVAYFSPQKITRWSNCGECRIVPPQLFAVELSSLLPRLAGFGSTVTIWLNEPDWTVSVPLWTWIR